MSHFCDHCGLPADPRVSEDGAGAYCCYGCRMLDETSGEGAAADDTRTREQQRLLYRLFAGGLMAMFVMAFSIAISSGYGFGALRSLTHDVDTAHWVLLVAAVPALLLLGVPVLRAAWDDVRRGRLSLNVLFTLGTSSAVAVSAVTYVRGTGPIYLETAVMLLALYTLGRYLTARAKGTASHVLGSLLKVPDTTYLKIREDGSTASVAPSEIEAGDRIRLRAGDVAPVDGQIVEGRSYVDESSLTGESRPAVKTDGDAVYAGTSALDGALTVRVTATGDARRLAQIEQAMRDALTRPPRLARRVDRIMQWLIPSVVVLALGTFGVWWMLAGFSKALYVALSVVLITCPCALGIAIPLTLVLGLEQAARQGVLVRSGQTLLDLAKVRAVVFDKTGTLSALAAPSVRVVRPDAVPAGAAGPATEEDVLRRVAAVEQGTRHALASALVGEAEAQDLDVPDATDVQTHSGAGVVGTVVDGGRPVRVAVGNEALLDTLGVGVSGAWAERVDAETDAGRTVLYVVEDGAVAALVTLEERLASYAAEAVQALTDDGMDVSVLTGDRPAAARRLSDALDVPVDAAQTPDAKVKRLAALREAHGPVAMVGDGINDAAALADADVGLAMASGATVSMEAADATLYNTDLRLVPWLRRLADRTDRTIRQNLWWTFGYNAVGLGLAVLGLLHPLAAVVIMTGSSLLVTWNAFRLRKGGEGGLWG